MIKQRHDIESCSAFEKMVTLSSVILLLSTPTNSTMSESNDSISRQDDRFFNASRILDNLLLDYDKRLRPGFGGPPTPVDVNINIRSMGPISELDMDYQMDCYFRQGWVDTRLQFNSSITKLQVSINILEEIWKPDTHFYNGKKSYLHTVTTPNKLLRITREGRILYSMRLTIKASCPMYLQNFPMDTQSCPLKFGSQGYGTRDIVYSWTNGSRDSIKMASDMTMSQFDLIGYPATNGTVTHMDKESYSVLYVHFIIRRHMGYFLINVYVPCSLLVIISWVAFWINREATAERMTLVLTMAFLEIDNRRDAPKVSYSTALDYFVAASFAFVLASIIQFSGVHFFTKHGSGEIRYDTDSEEEEEEVIEMIERDVTQESLLLKEDDNGTFTSFKQNLEYHDSNNGLTPTDALSTACPRQATSVTILRRPEKAVERESCLYKFWNCLKGSAEYRRRNKRRSCKTNFNSVSKIDRSSRVLFPASFITFNIVYWYVYISKGGSDVRFVIN